MKKLLVATKNPGKVIEFKNILSGLSLEVVSLEDVGIKEDVEETGKTYFENSLIKALFYVKKSNLPVISDDGGLEIEFLNGAPGIKSRRWLGYEATDEELIKHLKKVAKIIPKDQRTAYFRTVVTFALPNGRYFQSEGKVKGTISHKPLLKILNGYPFRSFFYLPKIKKFYHESELSKKEERIYNHRYKAVKKLLPYIKQYARS